MAMEGGDSRRARWQLLGDGGAGGGWQGTGVSDGSSQRPDWSVGEVRDQMGQQGPDGG